MNPHILLKDLAVTKVVDPSSTLGDGTSTVEDSAKATHSSRTGFVSYVDNLLEKARRSTSLGLLSPIDPPFSSPLNSPIGIASPTVELASNSLLRRKESTRTRRNVSRFQIQRGGSRVGVVTLPRSTYRLGETVSAVVDFEESDLSCYGIHASLESIEIVDPSIALRSSASIQRATKKVYSHCSETTVCSRRTVFSFTIPVSATPAFITSYISLEWQLRFEFVISKDSSSVAEEDTELLEEVASDERGRILAAAQEISCESFDVNVPVKVHGTLINSEHSGYSKSFDV